MDGDFFFTLFITSVVINLIFIIKMAMMHKKLHTNPLTGLPNKEGFERARKNKEENKGSILYLDLDNFKKINDEYGHSVGDEVIKLFGNFLKRQIRSTDELRRLNGKKNNVAHFHGDEFVIFLDGASFPEAKKVKEKIISNLKNEEFLIEEADGNISISVSTTIGIALFEESYEKTIQQADAKMLEAKKEKGVTR